MLKQFSIILGGGFAMAMIVAALWAWQSALSLSATATRPDDTLWAVRSGAIALAALAQTILLTFVVGRIYRPDLFGGLLRIVSALIGGAALVCALALGFAGY